MIMKHQYLSSIILSVSTFVIALPAESAPAPRPKPSSCTLRAPYYTPYDPAIEIEDEADPNTTYSCNEIWSIEATCMCNGKEKKFTFSVPRNCTPEHPLDGSVGGTYDLYGNDKFTGTLADGMCDIIDTSIKLKEITDTIGINGI